MIKFSSSCNEFFILLSKNKFKKKSFWPLVKMPFCNLIISQLAYQQNCFRMVRLREPFWMKLMPRYTITFEYIPKQAFLYWKQFSYNEKGKIARISQGKINKKLLHSGWDFGILTQGNTYRWLCHLQFRVTLLSNFMQSSVTSP